MVTCAINIVALVIQAHHTHMTNESLLAFNKLCLIWNEAHVMITYLINIVALAIPIHHTHMSNESLLA